MTLVTEADGYHLDAGEGEALWFAGGLLTHKATGDQTDGQLMVAEVVGPRGTGSPLHLHEREDEAWYVLDGELTSWIGDRKLTASTGSFVFGPREVPHRFRVESVEARFLDLMTPAGFEHFTRSSGWPTEVRALPPEDLAPRDDADLDAIARVHGLRIQPG